MRNTFATLGSGSTPKALLLTRNGRSSLANSFNRLVTSTCLRSWPYCALKIRYWPESPPRSKSPRPRSPPPRQLPLHPPRCPRDTQTFALVHSDRWQKCVTLSQLSAQGPRQKCCYRPGMAGLPVLIPSAGWSRQHVSARCHIAHSESRTDLRRDHNGLELRAFPAKRTGPALR